MPITEAQIDEAIEKIQAVSERCSRLIQMLLKLRDKVIVEDLPFTAAQKTAIVTKYQTLKDEIVTKAGELL